MKVIDHKGGRFSVVGETHDSYYVTEQYEEIDGDAWWVPKSEVRLVNPDGTLRPPFIPHKQRMKDWREQWNSGDVKFVPDLFEYADALSRKLDNSADYGYRAEGRMKDLAKEVARLKGFEEWHTIAMQQFPEQHYGINQAWMKSKK